MKKPDWIRTKLNLNDGYISVKNLLDRNQLNTVCQDAKCPNISECFGRGTATFMILGNVCTRNCTFCNIINQEPLPVDKDEPFRLSETVKSMNLSYVVITSVTRDDLPDGGAGQFNDTITAVRELNPGVKIEVLIPDFKGNINNLETVKKAEPDVINHNIETAKRLYPEVRPQAEYERSLNILKNIKNGKRIISKSGIIIGLGETIEEIKETLLDIRKSDVDIITIGQYLAPSNQHYEIKKFYTPEEFDYLKIFSDEIGFMSFSAPLVRSSYHADEAFHVHQK
ncbi:lipoyl synthase [candidate division KSB1 bacterium]